MGSTHSKIAVRLDQVIALRVEFPHFGRMFSNPPEIKVSGTMIDMGMTSRSSNPTMFVPHI